MTDVARLGGGYSASEHDTAPTVKAVLAAATPGDPSSRLVIVAGPPGVGKTLLAAGLCRLNGFVHIDKDWTAGAFILESAEQENVSPDQAYGRPRYWQRLRPVEYAGAVTTACANLVGRRSVVLSGGWGPELSVDDLWSGLTQRLAPARLTVIHLDAPPINIWRDRMAQRGSRSDEPWFTEFARSVTDYTVWPGAHRLSSEGFPHRILQSAMEVLQ
ncbi:MAG: hypothetical protein VX656_10305 [Candidatus Latescibacterota bacterium]|nr:AAA family ATPase [Candidatus Latescibacterota bacterium]MEC8931370.1 hypothetical protein [Candidatus Latescibacterota bacterium]MEC8991625.1 hypothetical protein [Candidatus Latescibacterota bacterium]MEE3039944.1 hypothetical protein [Candidatus Latescibacterota bacterium]